jgi:hypothetical protein
MVGDKKSEKKGGNPREGRSFRVDECPKRAVCALMRAVCPGLHNPVENPSRESCKGRFLQSFREQMSDFHGLLRQNATSLFTLLG